MSITDEITTSERARARLAVAPEPDAAWPDALDPEPSAAEQARLAHGPLVINPTLRSTPSSAAAAMMNWQLRRFEWQRLQPTNSGAALVMGVYPVGWCTFSVWNEFVGTWVLSWGLMLPLIGLLLFANLLMLEVGERLPRFGRSWVEVSDSGVRMRLFYGRKPAVRGKGFRIFSLVWPRHAFLPWRDIAKVALYTASYPATSNQPARTMYWVKLWTANNTGYVALITDQHAQANELVNLLAQHASLSRWAYLDASQTSLLDPSRGPLDAATLIIWRADRQRIGGRGSVGGVTADMWRATQTNAPIHSSLQLRPRTLIKLVALPFIIALLLNYDYLLSFLLWQPPTPITADATWLGAHHDAGNSNASSQTLIPPLHEAWHSPQELSNSPALSLAAGKVLEIDDFNINLYNASTGQSLYHSHFSFPGNSPSDSASPITLSADGSYAYFARQRNSEYRTANPSVKVENEIEALYLSSGEFAWQHPTGGNVQFAYVPERNLLITSSPVTTTASISGTDYQIEALDAQRGKQVWHSADFGLFAPKQIAIGGDTVYALVDAAGSNLVALNIASGATRWSMNVGINSRGYNLQADGQHVYLEGQYDLTIYSSEGKQVGPSHGGVRTGSGAVLVDGRLISNDYGTLLATSADGQTTLSHSSYGDSYYLSSNQGENMVASNGLLFTTVNNNGNFFGDTRLLIFDLNTGGHIWRSPTFSKGDSSQPIIIGNGMLYTVYDGEIHAFAGAR